MNIDRLKCPCDKFISPLTKRISFIHPDIFNLLALAAAFLTGFCFMFGGTAHPKLFLGAMILLAARMLLNFLSDAVAFERGDNNKIHNKIMKALPDRYADILTVAGIVMSPFCGLLFGFLGVCTIFLVSYSGMLGKALGVSWQGCGPLDKAERMILFIIFAGLQYWGFVHKVPELALCNIPLSYLEICMLMFFVLGQVTVIRRVIGIYKEAKDVEKTNNLEN